MPIILSSGQVAERTAYFLELGLVPSRIGLAKRSVVRRPLPNFQR